MDRREKTEDAVWNCVHSITQLGFLNGLSAMLLAFEAMNVKVYLTVANDKSYVQWHIVVPKKYHSES